MPVSSSKSITPLEEAIQYTFRKKTLLKEALTHKSYVNEKDNKGFPYNERMEFLGDAVLSMAISRYLYVTYPEYSEAELSRIRAFTVREPSLAQAADRVHIGRYLLLGKGEEMTGGREKTSILADAFEALIGAIFLDGGLRNAEKFVIAQLEGTTHKLVSENLLFDFKTRLQEVSQASLGVLPNYITAKEEGPEHAKVFKVRVFLKDVCYGSGTGTSKKAAAQRAAQAALKKIDKIL